jgi:phenylpyruvate tautomerase PptA (4-oxalocrotonate tautomerase family)
MDTGGTTLPMIDVYAASGTFGNPQQLASDLARTLMTIEGVPDIPMFRQNTAGFVHEMDGPAISNVDGDSRYVRVQVLTNAGALDRDKQLAVVSQFTELVAAAAEDPTLSGRTWVLLTEAVEGGWGLGGHAHTNAELVAAARVQIAELSGRDADVARDG